MFLSEVPFCRFFFLAAASVVLAVGSVVGSAVFAASAVFFVCLFFVVLSFVVLPLVTVWIGVGVGLSY